MLNRFLLKKEKRDPKFVRLLFLAFDSLKRLLFYYSLYAGLFSDPTKANVLHLSHLTQTRSFLKPLNRNATYQRAAALIQQHMHQAANIT